MDKLRYLGEGEGAAVQAERGEAVVEVFTPADGLKVRVYGYTPAGKYADILLGARGELIAFWGYDSDLLDEGVLFGQTIRFEESSSAS
jgi:hypothetical protein